MIMHSWSWYPTLLFFFLFLLDSRTFLAPGSKRPGGSRGGAILVDAFLFPCGNVPTRTAAAAGVQKKTASFTAPAFLSSPGGGGGGSNSHDDKDPQQSTATGGGSGGGDVVLIVQNKDEDVQDVKLMQPQGQGQGQVQVQRYYHTFSWKYTKSNSSSSSSSSTGTAATAMTNPEEKEYSRTYKINYRREGSSKDPPILLIHGFGANVNHFRYNIPLLVQSGYQVFAVDLLGFGGSDKPKDEDYSISLWVDLLCDFIKEMSQSMLNDSDVNDNDEANHHHPWVVCGNSIGGLCSLGVTARMKHVVQACVLFNCAQGMSGFRYEEAPFYLRPVMYFIQKVVLAPDGYGGKFFENFKTRENVQSILLQQGVYGDTTNVNEELLEILLGPSNDEGAKEVFLKVFGGPAGPTPEEFLKEIECPILAIWGDSDPWVPVDRGTHQGLNFGDYTKAEYTLEILKGVGHCPHDEVPVQVHEKMLPWLQSLLLLEQEEGSKKRT